MPIVKPQNKKFKFNGTEIRIDEMNIEQARKAKKHAHAVANGYGFNDDARMQNYWIGVENHIDERIAKLEREKQ
jgi:hypothetical protein